MNVHHLELFYYVAKHGGVSAAARHMPYGIQQPAISAQILQLEDTLGITLFHRRPFKLTCQGTDLFKFIQPFFGGLTEMGERLRGGAETRLRIATHEVVQRDRIDLPLVTLPALEPVCRLFQDKLQRLRVEWFPTLEVGSLDLVSRYVVEGFGAGLGIATPATEWPRGVRALPLPDFPSVVFGALWMGKLSPLGAAFIEEAEKLAREFNAVPAVNKKR